MFRTLVRMSEACFLQILVLLHTYSCEEEQRFDLKNKGYKKHQPSEPKAMQANEMIGGYSVEERYSNWVIIMPLTLFERHNSCNPFVAHEIQQTRGNLKFQQQDTEVQERENGQIILKLTMYVEELEVPSANSHEIRYPVVRNFICDCEISCKRHGPIKCSRSPKAFRAFGRWRQPSQHGCWNARSISHWVSSKLDPRKGFFFFPSLSRSVAIAHG